MSTKSAADACFSIPEIVLLIATFIDPSFIKTLSYLSKTNRCTYLSLEQERSRMISCRIENVPSLSLFADRQLLRHESFPCRLLEIIGERGVHSDAYDSLASILNHIGESQTLDAFAYRCLSRSLEFVCVHPEIWNALRASSTTLRSLNIMSHPCNWLSLSTIEFTELRSLQLALSVSSSPSECRNFIASPAHIVLSFNVPRFLQKMQHLTNLVLILPHSMIGMLNMRNLFLPALIAIDIFGDIAPVGLTEFVTHHSELLRLHLCFYSLIQSPIQEQHLPKLRSLKFGVELMEKDRTYTSLIRARRPHLEHISIYDLRSFRFLGNFIEPFQHQLLRLDLKSADYENLIVDNLRRPLESFVALIEISVTIGGPPIPPKSGARYSTLKSNAELQAYLRSFVVCTSLKALHLHNPSTLPLRNSDLQNLRHVPPSLQYISWGNRLGTTTFRIVRDSASQSTHAEVCEIPPPPREIVHDWTSENTFRHALDLY
ncbi:hypothetical protein SCHPADRAFT_1000194 [Schizopora paradoxa]|uniref:F-box domain-containing protein n=1 Tax=Schizopora paradoxa TaxID=27342 RepID=A0A0H2RCJ5_9AGAM|nr:hypothetical protein SCHPADRAFT_1000194 [Schizopora paradoxa]